VKAQQCEVINLSTGQRCRNKTWLVKSGQHICGTHARADYAGKSVKFMPRQGER
jgi:hypothetical protein